MDTIVIENGGLETVTCEDVSKNGQPLLDQPVVLKAHDKKTVQQDNSEGTIRIKISAGYHPDQHTEKEKDLSKMPKPKLFCEAHPKEKK
jgi:hypothetical protein